MKHLSVDRCEAVALMTKAVDIARQAVDEFWSKSNHSAGLF